ncbi:MAG: poly(3-hydroxyalkanoate) depolymerase [Aeromicrobium sp.]|uniref:poly(3-hydroxyalkanoate) depolymerase n=1 Tax=Aeromicrobium sp. TaxID=1871063 RepID=UPI0039E2DB30
MTGVREELAERVVLDQRLRVSVRHGDAPGRPLILCNGIGASLDMLQPFVDALDPAITVIRFDVPGIGGSPLPKRPYLLATLAKLVSRLAGDLGHETFDVLGISWGGALAQQIAFQYPDRCRQLVLVATAPGWMMVPAHPKVLRRMITPKRYQDPTYAAKIAPEIYGGSLRDDPLRVRELMNTHEPVTSRRGYLLQLAAFTGWTSTPFLPMVNQPTLILAGDDDPIIPLANAKLMAKLLPNARLHVYADGHLGLIVAADKLAPVVADFLRS